MLIYVIFKSELHAMCERVMKKPTLFKKLVSIAAVSSGSLAIFSSLNIYQNNENFYDNVILPVLFKFDAETAHNIAMWAAKYKLFPKSSYTDPPQLASQLWHIKFPNPVGIAAGFDKQAEGVESLHKIGFGFVEVGSITPEPQPGNEKPRVFRLENNKAIINRFGFNSDGHQIVYKRIKTLQSNNFEGVIGINLGKNKESPDPVDDYVQGIKKFGDVAHYFVVNVSSPNTLGLRKLQGKDQLKHLLKAVVDTRNQLQVKPLPALLLKIAPDLSPVEKKDIADVVLDSKCKVDGLIISNTTVDRYEYLDPKYRPELGGLSGEPLRNKSTELISEMFKLTNGKIPIIGVGGIFSGKDALDKIKAGASLVQIYTSFVYHGPPLVTRIKSELQTLLQEEGYKSITDAVGAAHKSRKWGW